MAMPSIAGCTGGCTTAKFPYAVRQQTGMAAVRVHGNFLVVHPIIRRALWRYGGLVPVVTAGVGLVTTTTEVRGLVLLALLYVPCTVVLAALDARRARAARALQRGASWR